jgi:CO/xanthine dehydrogenase FAD-binding subunit
MITVETFDTLDQAAAAMEPGRDKTRFLGGGTLIMRGVNYGAQSFDRIVRTHDPVLRDIRPDASRIRIGAGVTMAQVMRSADLGFLAPVARSVGGPAVRNMATVGGNLFARAPFGDFATALLALDAIVHLSDGSEIAVEGFLANRHAQRALVSAVSVPRPMGQDFRFRKVTRTKPKGAAVMTIAAWLPQQGGRISQARLGFGGMGVEPMRAKAAEAALEGAPLDATGIARALDVATDGVEVLDNALASAWYRREVAPVHLRRLLLNEGA